MNGKTLTFEVYIEMAKWFKDNPASPEIEFIEKFFTDGAESHSVYYDEWLDDARLMGESFEDTWKSHLYSKCMKHGKYEELKRLFQTAWLNTIGYRSFLKLFDSFEYKYANNPFKLDKDSEVKWIEPAVREMYITKLMEQGWRRASKRKARKVDFKIPRQWNFKAKEYWFNGNQYMVLNKNGWAYYAKA